MFTDNDLVFQPVERIEFAFVLLPDDSVLSEIKELSQDIICLFQGMSKKTRPFYWGSYVNKTVTVPHVSIGQYGILGCEIDTIKENVKKISKNTYSLTEQMTENLSILDDHIFFDLENCFEKVNPVIEKIYLELRQSYFEKTKTCFPIAQALMNKYRTKDKIEIKLIEKNFQNWGIPEKNRIRPHFTLIYHPAHEKEKINNTINSDIKIQNKIENLKTIHFKRLGIVQIDSFGNPLEEGFRYACSLNE